MRGTARVVRNGAVALLVALSSIAVGAATAGATLSAKASIHLSQATNLASGQIVTVHGYHFLKRTFVGILECEPGAKTEAQCENAEFATTFDSSTSGTFAEPFQVSEDIVVGSTSINCL